MTATSLSEFAVKGVPREIARRAPRASELQRTILSDLTKRYEEAARRFTRELGGEDFKLTAAWKRRELNRKAGLMARSLEKTLAKERARIEQLPQIAPRRVALKDMIAYKQEQLDALIEQEVRFQAATDVVAHSGVADVQNARIMYFENLGPEPCPVCESIAGGNPYTMRQATTLGAAAHPNCACRWDEAWLVDRALLDNTRRQVKDGEVRLWDGSPRTPARGKARRRVELMRERKGGWAGKAIEQRKLATQRAS